MKKASEIAMFFIKNGIYENTPEDEERLQCMLMLANMAHISMYGKPLFKDEVVADIADS